MSKPLTIVAIFQANEGREEELAAALQKLVAPTCAEAGCINYDLHRDLDLPGRFLFFENWETRPHWAAHMESAHLKHHQETSGPLVAKVEIFQMEMTS
ncbi:MAG: putative quinol monooxygenase [Candidatus Krumholzibacteria bacterium]|nr:putative quinol monooxygenase [Candidatus Krumholzibacteria bacterium]